MGFFLSLQKLSTPGFMMEIDNTKGASLCSLLIDITYWSPKYAKYNETSSVDYLCKLSGAAAGLFIRKKISSSGTFLRVY